MTIGTKMMIGGTLPRPSMTICTETQSTRRLSRIGSGKASPPIPCPVGRQRNEIGFVSALFLSIKEILFDPAKTFPRMPVRGGIGGPLLFAIILGSFGAVVGFIFQLLLRGTMFGIMSQMNAPGAEGQILGMGFALFFTMLSPFIVAVFIFVESGICHAGLMLVGGANQGYETTFRTVCYVKGAAGLLSLVPCFGIFVSIVWYWVCGTIGLQETHQTTTGRALFAVLLPMIACLTCAFLLLITTFGTALLVNM